MSGARAAAKPARLPLFFFVRCFSTPHALPLLFFSFCACRRRSILDLLIRIECKGETDEQFESGRSLERWGIVRHREADGPVPAQDISHTSA